MTQVIAASSLFIGGLGCFRAVLRKSDLDGYGRMFGGNVLHMFYTLTDVLHFNDLEYVFDKNSV
jgi:hypothetical protein